MTSWFSKLKGALSNTSSKISSNISDILHKKKLEQSDIDALEEILITADLGVETTTDIIDTIRKLKFDSDIGADNIKAEVSDIIASSIEPYQKPFTLGHKLNVILVCGVNGNGKTTTIGKLAHFYVSQGKKVTIAACDTFRAAAVAQLAQWGERSKCRVITGPVGSDPASVAYAAIEASTKDGDDILFIDTAGRLHNNKNLMEELAKIIKVIKKIDDNAPHHTLLVLDATTGQNAFSQVKHFGEIAKLTGLVVTKLDGTAKGGIVIGLCKKFKLPIHFIGVGEQIDDLKPFNAKEFTDALVG
jgi:fused signal recognition particle receptor